MGASKAFFDIVVLAVYLLAANPGLTGIPLHEFVGLGAFAVMATHLIASAAGFLGRGRPGRFALNAVLLLALATCVVSGVMVSATALPALGLYATGYHFWDPLHALAAKVLLAALLVHGALHAPKALSLLRGRQRSRIEAADTSALTSDSRGIIRGDR